MRFTWDESKRNMNIKKHKLDFTDAQNVFSGPTFTFEDKRFNYGEQRLVTIGLLDVNVVVIAHTETEKEVRIISMRKANKYEQKIFLENL